jgi:hypothetical protein
MHERLEMPMKTHEIDTREELTNALYEASEIEHGLLLQYLFAALSLKKQRGEGMTGAQQELTRRWEGQILLVAREEMAHLGTVCNLLSAIGAPPHFSRPNFPQIDRYPFRFALARFSDEALYRFIRFELPKGEVPPEPPADTRALKAIALTAALLEAAIPDPLEYEYIGELYRQIRSAFNSLPEATLFIGPRTAQEEENWSRRMQITRVVDRATANTAIDDIIEDGEGAPAKRQGSHYSTFLQIRAELRAEKGFDAARPVVLNPRTREHADSVFPAAVLENPPAIAVAELFNAYYAIVLQMLLQLYSFGGETLGERNALRSASRHLMTVAIRPLAEILTEMPAMSDVTKGNAGPTFELYSPLEISTQKENRWLLLDEKYASVIDETSRLSELHSRLLFVAENVGLIRANIRRAREAEEQL